MSNRSDSPAHTDGEFDYAVVGLGIGGLALAALLAHAGKKVVAFERHYAPGGYGHTFREQRYSFCAELHYVWDCGPGERVSRFLEKLGLEAKVSFHRLNPLGFDRIVGPGIDYTIGSGFGRECQRLSAMFPQHSRGLKSYFQTISTIHKQMYDLPIGFTRSTVASRPWRFSHVARYLRWTLQDLFDAFRFPAELRLILAGQSAIFWAPPRDLSLLAHAGGVGSYDNGAYYPEQSFMHVMKSLLHTIKQAPGCRALLATEVTQIEVRDGLARTVTTGRGEQFTAKRFIFNGDARLSLDLIGAEHFPAAFREKLQYDYGPSVVSVYLGVKDFDLRKHGFGEENIFWHPKVDLNQVYDDQLAGTIPERPYFFCNAPTLRPHDPILAPEGREQLVIVAPCTYGMFRDARARSEEEYQAKKQEFRDKLIGVVEAEFAPGFPIMWRSRSSVRR